MTDAARLPPISRRGFCAATLALLAGPPAAAATGLGWGRIDPALRQRLARGVSLSHWFWMPLGGRPTGDPGYLDARDLVALADLGLGHVRLPVDAERLFPGNLADDDLLARLDAALDLIARVGLLAVVVPFGAVNRWTQPRQAENRRLVERLAEHLARRDPRHLAFAVVNEPLDVLPADWSPLLRDLVAGVRERLPETLLIGSAPLRPDQASGLWGAHRALMQLAPPADPNLALALHWYEPFWLTHAGAPWLAGAELAAVEAQAGVPYRGSDWQRERLAAELGAVADWAEAQAVPLYIGEFGTFRYGGAPAVEREAWAADCVDLFTRFALPWCWWDYAEGFGLATGVPGDRRIDPALVRALLRQRP